MRKITNIGPFTTQEVFTSEGMGQSVRATETHFHFVDIEGQGRATGNISSFEAQASFDASQRWN